MNADSELKDTTQEKVGGVGFFISCFALLPLSIILTIFAAIAVSKSEDPIRFVYFLPGLLLGFFIAYCFIRSTLSVLLHEIRHSILSTMAGNKWRKLNVTKTAGSFEYAYSEDTEHFNVFIALAPYWLPMFTVLALAISLGFFLDTPRLFLACVGVGIGIDLVLNLRDISPIQTDFSNIKGGFPLGLLYVSAMNLILIAVITIWVARETDGYREMFKTLSRYLY